MISEQEEKDLKKLAADYQVDYSELVKEYQKASEEADKTDKEEEKKKVDTDSEDIKSQEKKIDELMKRFHDLKKDEDVEVDIEEQIEDVETIQRNLKLLKEEGFIHDYKDSEGDNSTKEES